MRAELLVSGPTWNQPRFSPPRPSGQSSPRVRVRGLRPHLLDWRSGRICAHFLSHQLQKGSESILESSERSDWRAMAQECLWLLLSALRPLSRGLKGESGPSWEGQELWGAGKGGFRTNGAVCTHLCFGQFPESPGLCSFEDADQTN